jgi:hypothetical protein
VWVDCRNSDKGEEVVKVRGQLTLAAVLAVLAIAPASASAATTIDVNDSATDAPLESAGTTCRSTDAAEDCTLRAAVELANRQSEEAGGETVTVEVPAGTYTETLGSLGVEEGASVTIDGAGVGKTIIDGGGTHSVLYVEGHATLTLDGVTVRRGSEDTGGGIYVSEEASLAVDSSAVEDNEASEAGGGIFAGWASTVTIARSSISDNLAGGEESEEGNGGGVYADPFSSLAVEQSTIAANKAVHSGGGIYRETVGELCDLAVKRASKRQTASASALAAEESGGMTIKQSTIEGNTAEDGLGGGIDAQRSECGEEEAAKHVTARHSWTRGGSSPHPSARFLVRALRPASIVASTSELTIEQSAITKNRAQAPDDERYAGYGGGIFEGQAFPEDPIVNSTIAENLATYVGGGIADESDVEELISDTVFDNTVEAPEVPESAKHATDGVGRDVVVEEEGSGANLAADPYSQSSVIYLRDTIVAEPTGGEEESCEGPVGSLIEGAGYNLDYPTDSFPESSLDTCGMSEAENDLVGAEPQLDPKGLQENGGPTQTIALLSSSPAIGFVPLTEDCDESEGGPGLVDQRGEPRPGIAGKGCDIGAYEYQTPLEKEKEPAGSVVTSTTTTTTPTIAAGVSPFKIELPAQCASKRDIKIHIQNVKQLGIVSAVVSIDGKDRRTLRGRQLTTTIDLVGLPKGTFTIEILARTHSGHTLHGKRVYHTCHNKLPGRSYIPL